ncbi:MAG: secretin N-terminal domain-containing protein [Burkholderiales bacterium]|nr:secretin N-terminal domain-containing protein [Burkholderiales bacterium]
MQRKLSYRSKAMMDRPLAPAGSCSVAAVIGGARRAPIAAAFFAMLVTGCGTQPVARTDGHIKSEATPLTGQTPGAAVESSSIPEPVRQVSLPPPPLPRVDEVKYSVTVKDVPVQELLFAISRDTKANIDVYPGIEGRVTLNALDQTLKQILTRVSKQVDMRWEVDGPNIVVRPDSPYLKMYKIDYVNMTRDSSGSIGVQTQVVGPSSGLSGGTGAAGGAGQNSSATRLENSVKNRFWETLEKNIRDLLRETDKQLPEGSTETIVQNRTQGVTATTRPETTAQRRAGANGAQTTSTTAPGVTGSQAALESVSQTLTFREAASVIVNPETGTIAVRATSRQHEKISEFVEQVSGSAQRQVLIEATVVEVVLNDNYQSGVDWSALGLQGLGYSIRQNFTGASLTEAPFFSLQYRNPNAAAGGDISSTIKLLNSFGNTRVLSSPKIMTLNNQTAVMRVVENTVYFTVQSTVTPATTNSQAVISYNTSPNVVPEGFVMNVTPQVSDNNIINLNVRPSVTRITSYVNDPNPDLGRAGVVSRVPQIQTREFETMMRIPSGQTAILGGLMQDSFQANRDGLPLLARVPVLGDAVSYRNDTGKKSELVVFIRAMVIREASLESDLSEFRRYLPGTQFFKDASPSVDLMNPKSYQPVPVVPEGEPRKAP